MKRLIFIFVLLCGSTQAMAADLCTGLQNKSLSIDANGFHGDIGLPKGITLTKQDNKFTFKTKVRFINEPEDDVEGECMNAHITFRRTRAGGFVQDYTGWIFGKEPSQMAGTFIHTKKSGLQQSSAWYAEMKSIGK